MIPDMIHVDEIAQIPIDLSSSTRPPARGRSRDEWLRGWSCRKSWWRGSVAGHERAACLCATAARLGKGRVRSGEAESDERHEHQNSLHERLRLAHAASEPGSIARCEHAHHSPMNKGQCGIRGRGAEPGRGSSRSSQLCAPGSGAMSTLFVVPRLRPCRWAGPQLQHSARVSPARATSGRRRQGCLRRRALRGPSRPESGAPRTSDPRYRHCWGEA
jgi:hypothetical protein